MEIQVLYIVKGYNFKNFVSANNFEKFIKGKNFKDYELRILAEAFKQNLEIKDVEKIIKVAPDTAKMKLVLKGLNEGLNVEYYNNKELTLEQMALIYEALKQNLEVEIFNKPEFSIMKLENVIFEESTFNLLVSRYQETNAIAILIQEVNEDYSESITVNAVPEDEEYVNMDLVAIPAEDSEMASLLIENGIIVDGYEYLDFFERVYFYSPTKDLKNYLNELKFS